VFTVEEKKRFEQLFGEMLDDPSIALIADAALLRLKGLRAVERAAEDKNGMVVVKQTATKQTSPGPDGKPRVVETAHIEKVDVTAPMSDLLVKAGRLIGEAMMLRQKTGITVEGDVVINEATAARVLSEEFGDSGALNVPDDGQPGK
jgi:hypothetical protein